MPREILKTVIRKDLEISYFRGSGPGGQHRNKTDSGVSIKHKESGAIVRVCTGKSQKQNKKLALKLLVARPEFKKWVEKLRTEYELGKSVEEWVEEQLDEKYIKTEVKKEGKWERVKNNDLVHS